MFQRGTTPEMRVWAAVLRRLLRGESVDPASVSAHGDPPAGTTVEALASLHASGAIYLSNGTVTAAYPFSTVPTKHRVCYAGMAVYACCAVDALAVPSMVDEAATIESRCTQCDQEITVQMRKDLILASQSEDTAVFCVARDCCESGPAVLTRCPHINFFCGPDHMRRWQAENPGVTGDGLSLSQAVTRACETFASIIRLVRSADIGERLH
jgi:hypothetical protein